MCVCVCVCVCVCDHIYPNKPKFIYKFWLIFIKSKQSLYYFEIMHGSCVPVCLLLSRYIPNSISCFLIMSEILNSVFLYIMSNQCK